MGSHQRDQPLGREVLGRQDQVHVRCTRIPPRTVAVAGAELTSATASENPSILVAFRHGCRSPHGAASIRFLFVAPALCFRLPSDSRSPGKPLPSANTCPCRPCRGLSPPNECALPGARVNSWPPGQLLPRAWVYVTRGAARVAPSFQFVILDEAFFCHTFTDWMVYGCPSPVRKMKNMCC
jgi:hypothetical protein